MLMASRLSAGVRWPISVVVRRMSDEERRMGAIVIGLARRYWREASLAFAGNVAAAAFEGGSMAVLALALQGLFGEANASFGDALGPVGSLADRTIGGLGRETMFLSLVLVAVGMVVLRSGLQFGSKAAVAYLQAKAFKDIYAKMFDQVMGMSYARSSKYKFGDLAQYLNDSAVVGTVFNQLNVVLGNLLILFAYIALMFWLSWPMTLAAVLALVLLSRSLTTVVRKVRTISEAQLPARVKMGVLAAEFLIGLKLLHIFSRRQFARERLADAVEEAVWQERRRNVWTAVILPATQAVTVIGVAGFLVLGYFVLGASTESALPRLLTFLFVLYRFMPLFGNINDSRAQFSRNYPLLRRVSEMLRTDDKEYTTDGGRPFSGLRTAVEFRNISMSYDEAERPAVSDVGFTIPKGGMVALVGESGAGKTTIANLVLRLYDPTEGGIHVDGEDLRQLDLHQWRSRIGVVSQDTLLFHSSVRDNIHFGRLGATDDEIEDAARRAHAHDFIVELESGYDTVVGDRGHRLSGGQRQRVAIARAILRDPEILVLDEATSDLDSNSERIIQGAMNELRSERTVIAIAHRLSTIAMADQILVLDRGRIVEQGTHQELLAQGGRYAGLWWIQTAGDVNGNAAGSPPDGNGAAVDAKLEGAVGEAGNL